MALFRGFGRFEDGAEVIGDKVTLRVPTAADYAEWAALRRLSRDFLQPWEPTWAVDDLTRFGFRRRLRRYQRDMRDGLAYSFFVFRNVDGVLVGGLTLSNIRRGVAQSASLGYWMGVPYVRQGLMSDAVRAACRFAFRSLGLHRVEAACLTTNEASERLLLKVGFRWEGNAREYLKINGAWRDHVLFALLESELQS